MPYIHKLDVFTEWYSQLTAESLSKGGNGYCVVRSLGTKDQHNQLQMFLDGRNDKTYTFIGNTYEITAYIGKNLNPFGDYYIGAICYSSTDKMVNSFLLTTM